MKKLFLSLLLTCLCLCGCKRQEEDLLKKVQTDNKIIVGVKFDSKPFGFIDSDNQLKGFDVDVARAVAKKLLGDENAVEFKQVTASNRIFMLSSGAVDMVVATMTINDKRRQVVDFSSPYYMAGQAIMVKKDSDIRSSKDLNGKKVIIVLGTTSESNVRFLAPEARIQGFRTYTDAYTALKSDRGDALTSDDSILYGFLYGDKSLKILKERYTKEPYGIAFRKDAASQSLKNNVDEILTTLKEDGELERIRRKWIK